MKAIAGVVYSDDQQVNHLIEPMLAVLEHRSQGTPITYTFENTQLGLRGGQFGKNETSTIQVALDGHILNIVELRAALKEAGFRPSTYPSDIVAKAYEAWGTGCITKIEGDFSLAILDQANQQLLLARDRIGIRPLYWYQDQKYFIFGSDIKALLATGAVAQTAARDAIAAYLFLGYFPQDITPIEGVNKLLPAHQLLIQLKNQRTTISQYWSYSSCFHQNLHETPLEVGKRFHSLLSHAVERRLPKEPAIGCLMSGGLGSSSIAYFADKLKQKRVVTAFTVGFSGENIEDLNTATAVAEELGLGHELELIGPESVLYDFVKIIWYLGEPLADPNIFATWRMTQLASGITSTILSGTGSDEVLAGHARYIPEISKKNTSWLSQVWQPLALRWLIPALNRIHQKTALRLLKHARTNPWQAEYLHANALFDAKTLAQAAPELSELFDASIFLHKFHKLSEIPNVIASYLYFDVKTHLPDSSILQLDRLSAANGLTCEMPFLEKEMVEYLAGLQTSDERAVHETINMLKHLMHGHLSDAVISRPKTTRRKPLTRWTTIPHIREAFEYLLSGTLVDTGFLSKNWLKEQIDPNNLSPRSFPQLWALLALEIWFRLFINDSMQNHPPNLSLREFFEK